MAIICKNSTGAGCRAKILEGEGLRIWSQSNDAGIHIIANPHAPEAALNYERVESTKNALWVPYKLHCLSCGKSLGSTVKMGDHLLDSFAWDKSTLALSNGFLLPNKKWAIYSQQLRKVLKEITEAQLTNRTQTPPLSPSKPTKYCKMDNASIAALDKLTATVPREYQKELMKRSLMENTTVCLPTGSGKTLVAAGVIHAMRALNPEKIALFVVNNVPLVHQQGNVLQRELPAKLRVEKLTGGCLHAENDAVIKRLKENISAVLVITCGKLMHLLLSEPPYLSLGDACILVMDEAHHATGNSPYANLVKVYHSLPIPEKPLLLSLTASPLQSSVSNTSQDLVDSILGLIGFLSTNIAYPCEHLSDLQRHVIIPDAECVTEPMSPSDMSLHRKILTYCGKVITILAPLLPELGDLNGIFCRNYWIIRGTLRKYRRQVSFKNGCPQAAAVLGHVLDVLSSLELLEVVGSEAAIEPLKGLFKYVDKAATPLEQVKKDALVPAHPEMRSLQAELNEPNPTLSSRWKVLVKVLEEFVVKSDHNERCIVFVRMRRTARKLCSLLRGHKDVDKFLNPQVFVGHTGQDGMGDWREQETMLKYFHRGFTRLLIATNVLEEGLDVPTCKLVVRFNCEHSLRSLIQSRGRASRARTSKYISICKNEIEAKKLATAQGQEMKMLNIIQRLAQMPSNNKSYNNEHELKSLDMITEKEAPAPVQPFGDSDDEESMSSQVQNLYEGALAFTSEDYQDETEIGMGLDGSIANVTQDYCIENLKAWLETVCKVFGFEEVPASRAYAGLRMVDFTLHGVGKPADLGWHLLDQWRLSSMWLNVCIGNRSKAKPSVHIRNLRCGNWNGTNKFSPVSSVWHDSCHLEANYSERSAHFEFQGEVHDDSKHLLSFSFWHIMDFVLIDTSSVQSPMVYFTLRHPPKLTLETSLPTEPYAVRERIVKVPSDEGGSLGQCHVYLFTVASDVLSQLLNTLARIGKRVWFAHVEHSTKDEKACDAQLEWLKSFEIPKSDDAAHYAWHCVISTPGYWLGRFEEFFWKELSRLKYFEATRFLYALADELQNDMFSTTTSLVEKSKLSRWMQSSSDAQENLAWIKRVIITPTRILYCNPDPMQKNRVLRNFSPELFLRVSIRDEDLQMISSGMGNDVSSLVLRVRNILEEGIEVGNFHYQFLTSTSSQLRDHTCWFVRSSEDGSTDRAQSIRDWMGDFSGIKVVATYISRLGQSFSSSIPTVSIPGNNWKTVQDFKQQKYCFSDGVGTISSSLASEVADSMGLVDTPSAYQIRFGGVKGVVAVDPTMNGGVQLCCRPSMLKFNSEHSSLEILNVARPLSMYLNHQVIMQFSNLGIEDDYFLQCLNTYLHSLVNMLKDDNEAYHMIERMNTCLPRKALQEADVNVVQDPFFRSILMAFFRYQIYDIINKARIPIGDDKGRVLLGVVDETGTLNYGEVFIQISEDMTNTLGVAKVITRPVAVLKSPCLHPGDIRILTAVDKACLHHHQDVIVFPRKGPRPHPDEMSGSDLDGDLYYAAWDPRLVPTQPMYEPMDYSAPEKRMVDGSITVMDMVNFICEYIEKDNLGVIDNSHKALSDSKGMDCESCVTLAELHSLAVDAPKTGKWARIPSDILEELQKEGYPDFMMKRTKKTYKSGKILGEIFRRSERCSSATQITTPGHGNVGISFDNSYIYRGYEEYLAFARKLRNSYNTQLLGIMETYKVETEGELLSGCINQEIRRLGKETSEIVQILQDLRNTLVNSFRRKFTDEIKDISDPDAHLKQASAWYFVTYHEDEKKEACKLATCETALLSFPWTVANVLAEIKVKNAEQGVHCRIPFFSEVTSKSTVEHFLEEREALLEDLTRRETALAALHERLKPIGNTEVYGSSAVMLFSPQSDLDVMLTLRNMRSLSKDEQNSLLKACRGLLENFYSVRHVADAKVPNLELKFRSPSNGSDLRIDVTADSLGLQKAMLLREYILRDPWLLPVMRLILKWGRATGLMGHKRFAPIPSNILTFLVLNMCIQLDFIQPVTSVPTDIKERWDSFCQNIGTQPEAFFSSGQIGKCLDAFFDHSKIGKKLQVHPALCLILGKDSFASFGSSDAWSLLEEQMQIAGFALALSCDIAVLFKKSKVTRVFYLGRNRVHGIIGAEKQYSRWFQRISGADVSIGKTRRAAKPELLIQATGTSGQIHAVGRAFEKLVGQADSLQHSTKKMYTLSPTFVEGSSQLLVEQHGFSEEHIVLEDYFGYRQPHHDNRGAYIVRAAQCQASEKSGASAKFLQHFKDRLDLMDQEYSNEFHGKINLAVSFGYSYVVDPPPSFIEDPEGITLEQLNSALQHSRRNNLPLRISETMLGSKVTSVSTRRSLVPKKPTIRGSFYSGICNASTDEIDALLRNMGFGVQATEDVFKVILHMPACQIKAVYSQDLEFINSFTNNTIWLHTDIKRGGPESIADENGKKCDIRFQIRTRQHIAMEGVQASELKDLLSWKNRAAENAKDGHNLRLKAGFRSQVLMIRQCHQQTYEYTGCEATTRSFLQKMKVRVATCKVYCRPDQEHIGCFKDVEESVDVRIRIDVDNVPERTVWNALGHRLWDFSMQISDLLSRQQ